MLAIYNGHVSGRTVGSTQDVTGVEQDLHLDSDVVNLLAVTPSGQQTKSSTFTIKGGRLSPRLRHQLRLYPPGLRQPGACWT